MLDDLRKWFRKDRTDKGANPGSWRGRDSDPYEAHIRLTTAYACPCCGEIHASPFGPVERCLRCGHSPLVNAGKTIEIPKGWTGSTAYVPDTGTGASGAHMVTHYPKEWTI